MVTVEFIQDFLDKNRQLNGHMPNIDFVCADVMTLEMPPASFDLVFSCWLQMYLTDPEVSVPITQRLASRPPI
jgi:phosphoethanolamine N-methyltransferase